jgi:hypothetical protein
MKLATAEQAAENKDELSDNTPNTIPSEHNTNTKTNQTTIKSFINKQKFPLHQHRRLFTPTGEHDPKDGWMNNTRANNTPDDQTNQHTTTTTATTKGEADYPDLPTNSSNLTTNHKTTL